MGDKDPIGWGPSARAVPGGLLLGKVWVLPCTWGPSTGACASLRPLGHWAQVSARLAVTSLAVALENDGFPLRPT